MFDFLKPTPKHFIDDVNSNSLSIILSGLLLHPYLTHKEENLIKMLQPFKHPENVFNFLVEFDLLTPLGDGIYYVNLDNEIVKTTMEYYKKIDEIMEKTI